MKTIAILALAAALSGCATLDAALKPTKARVMTSMDCTHTVTISSLAGVKFVHDVDAGDAAVIQATACNQALANAVKAQSGRQ